MAWIAVVPPSPDTPTSATRSATRMAHVRRANLGPQASRPAPSAKEPHGLLRRAGAGPRASL